MQIFLSALALFGGFGALIYIALVATKSSEEKISKEQK